MASHDDLPHGVPTPVHAAIADSADWETRFELLDAHLLGVLARRREDPETLVAPEVREAWRVLQHTGGRARIQDVAAHVGWSRRHLAARFAAEYGLGPKQAARLMRFDHARTLLASGHALADAAAGAGYADQAHLTREWRTLAGRSPTETLREQFPIVQDAAGSPVAPSPS